MALPSQNPIISCLNEISFLVPAYPGCPGKEAVKQVWYSKKGKGSPYSIAERWVPELIPVLGSQPAVYVSHKPDGRQPLLSAKPAVTLTLLRGLLPILLLGEQRHDMCEQFA